MPHLLEGGAVAGAVATGVRGVEGINRFFAQHLRQVFQGGRLAAAEENLAVHPSTEQLIDCMKSVAECSDMELIAKKFGKNWTYRIGPFVI